MNPDHPRFTPRSHGVQFRSLKGEPRDKSRPPDPCRTAPKKGEISRAKGEPSQDHFLSSNKNPEGREKGKGET